MTTSITETSNRDEWLKIRPVTVTSKINKTITIPAFGDISCGYPKRAILFASPLTSFNDLGVVSIDNLALQTGFALEAWVNLFTGNQGVTKKTILQFQGVSASFLHFYVDDNNFLNVQVRKSATDFTLTSAIKIDFNKWTHVAAVYDGSKVYLYINGVQDANTLTIASPLDTMLFVYNTVGSGGGGVPSDMAWLGYIDEIRIWDSSRSGDQIRGNMNRYVGVANNIRLKRYYRITDDGVEYNVVDNHQASLFDVVDISDNDYELGFGAAFISYKYDLVASNNFSLLFPLSQPRTSDHTLCISWEDDDGVFQRRLIYEAAPVKSDIAPYPLKYTGEKINKNCSFEFWNVDGKEKISLSDDVILGTSLTSFPKNSLDHSAIDAASTALAGTSALAATYPLTFPIVFNTQQTYL